MKNTAETLNEIVATSGYSAKRVGNLLGISPSTVSEIRAGKKSQKIPGKVLAIKIYLLSNLPVELLDSLIERSEYIPRLKEEFLKALEALAVIYICSGEEGLIPVEAMLRATIYDEKDGPK